MSRYEAKCATLGNNKRGKLKNQLKSIEINCNQMKSIDFLAKEESQKEKEKEKKEKDQKKEEYKEKELKKEENPPTVPLLRACARSSDTSVDFCSKNGAMIWPTIEEVRAYCRIKPLPNTDPEAFVEYYEAQGWVNANGIAITNWRLCANNWERRELKRQANTNKRLMINDYD